MGRAVGWRGTPKPGDRFGEYTLIEDTGHRNPSKRGTGSPIWLAECSCGKVKEVALTNLQDGRIRSCGCAKYQRLFPRSERKHSKLFGVALTAILQGLGARMALSRKIGGSPNRIYDLCSGRAHPPSSGVINQIAAALGMDPETRRGLHVAAALDSGYEIGPIPRGIFQDEGAGI